ncbi:ABC transporter ATP-binding protein [Paenibacillus sp. P96]|uniref:ABC transporter ATP-binding protein n=1 Tax=Paenibacillus zeirhizosphaerae TaxID=2987519 RepID=A0ABT9FV17_9BACL|nr:ABC transporter ATP-binding protein [Paenibacillus sp. P96]MDP4098566.1 ABC transporter ATP-binding protein [Paenibacillus sp. P96]
MRNAENIVIEMENVTKARGSRQIGPITLAVPAGYVVALVGHNGSGKSTLLHMLTRLALPDSGQIRWFGRSYEGELPPDVRQWIGYMPEHFFAEENRMTAEQAAKLRALWYSGWDEIRFRGLMEKFEVPAHTKLSKLSKGERRRFELAAALAPHPRLLLLDEPSSGLDPFAWKMMLEELRDCMRNEKTTIIMATHIVDEIKRLADYIVLMHEGKLLGCAEKDHLLESGKEIWFEGTEEDAADLPCVLERSQEGLLQRVVTMEAAVAAEVLQEAGIRILRTRALELDELMMHWAAGRLPQHMTSVGKGNEA